MTDKPQDNPTDAETVAETAACTFVASVCESGQSLLRLGEDLLAGWLGYDVHDAESRQQMRRTTAIGAGGVFGLGFLFGTRTGRTVLRDVAVLGGAAILGKAVVDAGAALVDRLGDPEPPRVSLLAAVIAWAAGGRAVTDAELHRIDARLEGLSASLRAALLDRNSHPVGDAGDIAARIAEPDLRREIYAIAALLAAPQGTAGRLALDRLARAFGYGEEEARRIRAEVA